MGSRDRREREREGLRTRILDAARELFAAYGYEAVTMRRVAERIEYTTAVIYAHFRDKETLLRELCEADFRAFHKSLGRIAHAADPVERLRRMGRAYVGFALENPNHYRLMFMNPAPPGAEAGRDDPGREAYESLRATVAEAWAAGRFRDSYTDPELLALVIWGGVHGIVSLYLAMPPGRSAAWPAPQQAAEAMTEALLHGLGRPAGGQGIDPGDRPPGYEHGAPGAAQRALDGPGRP
jgi:AcrR family transcriptional regulator